MNKPDVSQLVAVEGDHDLDKDPIALSDGTVLDETAAEKYGREVANRAAAKRAGRPSLSGGSAHSPQVATRVSREIHARLVRRARDEGKSVSELVREALEQYV